MKKEFAANAAQKSKKIFFWIQFLYARLSRSNSSSKLRDIISSISSDFNQAYERDLKAMLNLKKKNQIKAIAIFRWTLFAEQPFIVRELCEALIVDRNFENKNQESDTNNLKSNNGFLNRANILEMWNNIYVEDQILKLCDSLIVIRSENVNQPIENHEIYFVHFSIKEYLLKINSFVFTLQTYTQIVISCFKYLYYDNFNQKRDFTDKEFGHKMKKYAFLRYASFNLKHHLNCFLSVTTALIQLWNRLLDSKEFKRLLFLKLFWKCEFESWDNYITNIENKAYSSLYMTFFFD